MLWLPKWMHTDAPPAEGVTRRTFLFLGAAAGVGLVVPARTDTSVVVPGFFVFDDFEGVRRSVPITMPVLNKRSGWHTWNITGHDAGNRTITLSHEPSGRTMKLPDFFLRHPPGLPHKP